MIKSFAHRGLEHFFRTGNAAGIQPHHAPRVRLILAQLQQARTLADICIPALHPYELTGERQGVWAVSVQAPWQITFRFAAGEAEAVAYETYA
ncbi:MAG: type II toxin-antitoxin system RelE/ParE family toxin [Caldilineales bacterium]|nr:type II toxin-antitoxin system RelE/ParE family toxin [Caldilineales bacterium]